MKQNYEKNINVLAKRAKFSYSKYFFLSILGGFFIGFGYLIYHIVIANRELFGQANYLVASALFPVGIVMCVFFAGTLFTLDTALSLKFLERKIKLKKTFIILGIVLLGNFIGTLIMACFSLWIEIYESANMLKALRGNAQQKANLSWYVSLGSSIICGILVGVAVWIANSLKGTTSRVLILWLIVTVFVISGTQHVVANMYIFNLAWLKQVEFSSIGAIFENLLPTMIGNWIGGAFIIPGTAYLIKILSAKES